MFKPKQTFKIKIYNTFHGQYEVQAITVKSVRVTDMGIELVTFKNDVVSKEFTKVASYFKGKIVK